MNLEKFAKNPNTTNPKTQNTFNQRNQSCTPQLDTWEKILWFVLGMFGVISWIILILLFLGGNVGQKIKYWLFGFLTSIGLVILFLVIIASSI